MALLVIQGLGGLAGGASLVAGPHGDPVDHERAVLGHAQRHVQDRPVFRGIHVRPGACR